MTTSQMPAHPTGNEQGFVLATVLVFLVVLTLTALFAANATRIDVQLVNNEQTEKEAFYIAEAGIAEALVRLDQTASTNATVDGTTFDSSLAGSYAPDATQVCWKAQILFGGSGPTKTGSTVTTPTLQPASSRLAYSTSSGSSESLTIGWERSDGTNPTADCVGTETIRTIGGKNVMEIVSTGQSGLARRRVIRRVVDGHVSTIVLRTDYCPGVYAHGNGAVGFPGAVQVNSTCGTAVNASGTSSIVAAGRISVAGNVSPTPRLNRPQVADPLAALPAPSLASTTLPTISRSRERA